MRYLFYFPIALEVLWTKPVVAVCISLLTEAFNHKNYSFLCVTRVSVPLCLGQCSWCVSSCVPSEPFLMLRHWRVFVLAFSQTSILMLTPKACGLTENYSFFISIDFTCSFNVEFLFQLSFSISLDGNCSEAWAPKLFNPILDKVICIVVDSEVTLAVPLSFQQSLVC